MGRGVIRSKTGSRKKIPAVIYLNGWKDVASYNNNGYSASTNLQRGCSCTTYNTPQSGSGFSFVVDCTNISRIVMNITIGGTSSTDGYGTVYFYGNIGGQNLSFSNFVSSTTYGSSSTTLRWDVSALKGKQTFSSTWRATCRTGDLVWSTNQTISITKIMCER